MSPELELVRQWLERAVVDLRSAGSLLAAEPPICETACFHCQQAIEKALKAFLICQDVEFEWSHEIAYLVELCVTKDRAFEQWDESASPLTEYAVHIRYPSAGPGPTAQESRTALDVARGVYEFVLQRLPAEVNPEA